MTKLETFGEQMAREANESAEAHKRWLKNDRRRVAEKVREACEGAAHGWGAWETARAIRALDLTKLLEED